MATSLQQIAGYLDQRGWRYAHDAAQSQIITGVQAENVEQFLIAISVREDGEYVEFFAPQLLKIKDHVFKGVMFQALLAIAWEVKLLRWQYDPTDGEVRASIAVALEDAPLTLRQFDRCLEALIHIRSKRLVDLMATPDLYQDGNIPPEVQHLLEQLEATQQAIDALRPDSSSGEGRELTASAARSRAALEASTEEIAALEAQKQHLREQLAHYDAVSAGLINVSPPNLTTIQQTLIDCPDTALLSFYTTDDDTHIFVVRCDRIDLQNQISVFSGTTFEVDPAQGLEGRCDFILSRSPEQYYISSPVLTIVEAKNESIPSGLGQCIATMIAVRLFNQREGQPTDPVYGAVTTGTDWKFLKLEGQTAFIDTSDYYIKETDKILGILVSTLQLEPGE